MGVARGDPRGPETPESTDNFFVKDGIQLRCTIRTLTQTVLDNRRSVVDSKGIVDPAAVLCLTTNNVEQDTQSQILATLTANPQNLCCELR